MAISKEFLSLFSKFIANYKQNGLPTFYTWAKEQNHNLISSCLDELFTIVTANQQSIHDASIIENLSITVLLSARSNPYLLTCWINFLTDYNTATKQYAPIGTIELSVGPSGVPSENMIRHLKSALIAQQTAFESTQKVHQVEVEQLKRQISDLQKTNGELRLQNDQLNAFVRDRNIIEAMHPQIQTTQEQLASISKLLSTLYEVTKQKPITETLMPDLSVSAEPTKKEAEKESKDKFDVVTSSIIDDTTGAKKVQPPEPPPPPPQDVGPKTPNKSVSTFTTQNSKTESKPPLLNQSFFTPQSNDQLLDGITSALAKMTAKKKEKNNSSPPDEHEKKKSPNESVVAHLS